MDQITLAVMLTAGGAVAGAAIVRQLIELLKASFPGLDARVSGATQAFVLSAALYVGVWLAVGAPTPEGAFIAFLSWLSCATSAIGINSAVRHLETVTAKPELVDLSRTGAFKP